MNEITRVCVSEGMLMEWVSRLLRCNRSGGDGGSECGSSGYSVWLSCITLAGCITPCDRFDCAAR